RASSTMSRTPASAWCTTAVVCCIASSATCATSPRASIATSPARALAWFDVEAESGSTADGGAAGYLGSLVSIVTPLLLLRGRSDLTPAPPGETVLYEDPVTRRR